MTKKTNSRPQTKAELMTRLNSVEQSLNAAIKFNSTLVRRAELSAALGKQFGGDRDLYDVFGYLRNPQYEHYLNVYERDGLATRVVDTIADETWRENPVLAEGEKKNIDELDDSGQLQKDFKELDDEFHFMTAFSEMDKSCGMSRFALLFLGLPGELEEEADSSGKLMYIMTYDEGNADIAEETIVKDPQSPRFGLPEFYHLSFDDRVKSFKRVHHSRVVHVKEGISRRDYRRVYGIPRLQNLINRFFDIEKVVGGGSEAFWLLIRKGLALTSKDEMTLPKEGSAEYEEMVDEIEEYEHGLSRIMKLFGFDVTDLGSEPVNSRHQFDVLVDYVAATSHIPQRILMGSEAGNLASSQDQFNLDDYIRSRQTKYAEPYVLRPTLKRLGELKILKLPEKYTVFWKSLFTLTDMEKSQIAGNFANALATVTGNAPETAMPIEVFTQRYVDYKPSPEEQQIIEEKKREADEANQQPFLPQSFGMPRTVDVLGGSGFDVTQPAGVSKKGSLPIDRARLNQIKRNLEALSLNVYRGVLHYHPDTSPTYSNHHLSYINEKGNNDHSTMIAFKIPDEIKDDLKKKYPWMDKDVLKELHITLCYLGDSRTLPEEKIYNAVRDFAERVSPLKVTMQGIGRFISDMDKDPIVATFDSQGNQLVEMRQKLVAILNDVGIPYWENHGFIPHMTMAYIDQGDGMPADTIETMEINFDAVYLVVGDEWREFKFGYFDDPSSAEYGFPPPRQDAPTSSSSFFQTQRKENGSTLKVLKSIIDVLLHGGPGSGNFGHAGRPGKVGGSASSGSGLSKSTRKNVRESKNAAKMVHAQKKQCYRNAIMALSAYDENAEYVQGIACFHDIGGVPIDHGWIELNGEIIDPTVPDRDGIYYSRTRWSSTDALKAAVEQEFVPLRESIKTPEAFSFLKNVLEDYEREKVKQQHYGPGDHKSGSSQAVHGGGSGGGNESDNDKRSVMPMANPDGRDTLEQYRNADGTWTPERQKLHDEIVDRFFDGKSPVDDPRTIIMGGGPAAGKTTLITSGHVDIPENHILAAGDDIKPLLPEYMGANAAFVHEESSYLSKVIARRATSEGYNLVMDGTGDNSLEKLQNKVESMRPLGQPVHGYYVTVDIDVALQRAANRAERTGRFMPPSVLIENHKGVSRVLDDAVKSGLFDHLELYDSGYSPPKLIMTADGTNMKIVDQDDFDKFLEKEFYK